MNFPEAEAYLLSLGNEVAAMKLGLESIRTLLTALGQPQNNYLKVQVAGTNGKGSVCAFLDSICRVAGVRVGLYTSPHLISITERIRVNGEDIGEDDFARLASLVREVSVELVASGELPSIPTFFEQVTAIGLLAFAEAKVEIAILETGLGGRLDATTAANSEICAITRIDLDHQQYLGETIEEIASEKAAIIHAGSRVVVGEQRPEVMRVLLARCHDVGVEPMTECEAHQLPIDVPHRSFVMAFRTRREIYHDPNLSLLGRHQIENARVAVMLAERLRFDVGLTVDRDKVVEGLEAARHPGRLEYQGRYLFDGAHNIAGAKALVAYLDEFESRPITLVFGAMDDKPVGEILGLLVPRTERIIFTQPTNERSLTYDELLAAMPKGISRERTFVTDTGPKAIDIAETITPQDGVILVTGSLYLVGEVKKLLNN